MVRMDAKLLDTNDLFPEMELHLIPGDVLKTPRDFGDGYAVFILYRGYW